MSFDWGSLISTGLGLAGDLIGSNQQKKALQGAANAATPTPYSTSGPMGGTYFDPRTNTARFDMAQNPFYPMFQSLGATSIANAATAPGSFLYGADPELADAYRGTTGQGIVDAAQGRYGLLSQLAAPQEQRAFQGLQDRLFGQGRLGTSGGGIDLEAFYSAQQDADLKRQLAAQDWAQQNALNRFTAAQQAVASGQAGQMNQANIGSGAFTNLQNAIGRMFDQANVGVGAMAGTPSNIALQQAQAAGAPYQGISEFLKNSGAYDWLGGKIGGWFPGTSAGVPGGAPVTPNQTGPVNIPAGTLNIPQAPIYQF